MQAETARLRDFAARYTAAWEPSYRKSAQQIAGSMRRYGGAQEAAN